MGKNLVVFDISVDSGNDCEVDPCDSARIFATKRQQLDNRVSMFTCRLRASRIFTQQNGDGV